MAATRWHLKGQGYEFCNCDFGCGCNFGGFPNSKDGSCRAFVGLQVSDGRCGAVDLTGVKCASIFAWPKATTEQQVDVLGQIFTGTLGGNPWDLLGPTYRVVGLVRAKITIEGSGRKSTVRAEGIGEGRGDTFKNPVTGEDHVVDVVLDQGFIWKKGECGIGSFRASAAGLAVASEKSNWIHYQFAWSNAA